MSDHDESGSSEDESDFYNDYYEPCNTNDMDPDGSELPSKDPEFYEFQCLTVEETEKLLAQAVNTLREKLIIDASYAKMLLHYNSWDIEAVITSYTRHPKHALAQARIKPLGISTDNNNANSCDTCMEHRNSDEFGALECGHQFCKYCWIVHFEVQILQGKSTSIECMSTQCDILAPSEFVLELISAKGTPIVDKYKQFSLNDWVQNHPQLRFCPGQGCCLVIKVEQMMAKRVTCTGCLTVFCARCGGDYHAPADCDTIRKWITKCADDSETANYISAHTKDCPKCHICIEKNGGCNHMQCFSCKHDFCWMCLGDWRTHGSQYYECSRYKENPNIANESAHAQAREALKKYLFYFERWENHSKSLRLERNLRAKIQDRINTKVLANEGTWIDWQYLLDAANLLAKCRYTLQYTYPYAYYLEPGARKELFEYQQATLEAEIENLSWKVERAETTDRGDLENQMDIAEKRRTTLLKDFLAS